MILCPSCGAKNISIEKGCSQCGFEPTWVDGFLAYAPDLAKHNDSFSVTSFEDLARVEASNFWFRTRNALVVWALRKYFPKFKSLLEVGCGTGFVLSGIAKDFPDARIVGSEIYTAGLAFAARRLPDIELFQMDVRKLPYEAEFDVVTAFDVIEHILEDELVLQNFHRAIKPGGACLITVPQHQWLWSPVDEAACHVRRYSRTELVSKVRQTGLQIKYVSSFVSLLVPLMWLSRKRSGQRHEPMNEFNIPRWLNYSLEMVMKAELLLLKAGVRFPIGGSLLLIAIKPA